MDENIPGQTPQQRYRKTDKCKVARERYYENKGKLTAHEYYVKNREKILQRSKDRYNNLKNDLAVTPVQDTIQHE
jgi:hypothetical protein